MVWESAIQIDHIPGHPRYFEIGKIHTHFDFIGLFHQFTFCTILVVFSDRCAFHLHFRYFQFHVQSLKMTHFSSCHFGLDKDKADGYAFSFPLVI